MSLPSPCHSVCSESQAALGTSCGQADHGGVVAQIYSCVYMLAYLEQEMALFAAVRVHQDCLGLAKEAFSVFVLSAALAQCVAGSLPARDHLEVFDLLLAPGMSQVLGLSLAEVDRQTYLSKNLVIVAWIS